jgi:SAM-dependent methyltransferase
MLQDSSDYWDRHARRDPLWAILSDTGKREGQWDVARFFQTGISEIASLFYELEAQQFVPRRGTALDFGCGVGRLTQALAPRFDRVVGVDVSPAMRDLAMRFNACPQTVSYVCNQTTDLRVFRDQSFDFIVSNIVLQHVRPEITRSYLAEFLRVLTPGGLAVFQLPSHHRRPENRPLESIVKPMPDDAYRASLVVGGMPRVMKPGGEVTLQVDATNASMVDWIQREYGVFSVGDHWFDGAGGRMVTRDDGRTRLRPALRAGDTCRVPLTIKAPPDEGTYQCEIDVAHEGVLWFSDRGSDVVRFVVRVAEDEMAAAAAAEPASRVDRNAQPTPQPDDRRLEPQRVTSAGPEEPAEFPMYGVPLHIVTVLLAGRGATLLHIENDRSCGDDWVSYRYFVRAG